MIWIKKHVSFLLLLSVTGSIIAQDFKIDTLKMLYCAKLQVLESEGAYFTHDKLKDFADKALKAKLLKAGRYSNVSFILIENRNGLTDTSHHSLQAFKKNWVYWNCDYIVAYMYSTRLYYKLKGFRNNDFKEFINHLQLHNPVPLPEFMIKDKKAFLLFYHVDDLDLGCLWDYYFGKRRKNKSYPCIKSCIERDFEVGDPH